MKRFWILAAAYVACRLLIFSHWPWLDEDAYIALRCARNLALSGHPVMNLGRSSWPCTSPLWVAWLAVWPTPWWAIVGSLFGELGIIGWVWRRYGWKPSCIFAAVLGLSQGTAALSNAGMEMWVYVALFLWSLEGRGWAQAGLLMVRPEGLMLWWLSPRKRWWAWVAAVPVWVAMGILCGRWAPAGVTAKVTTYGIHFGQWRWLNVFWPWSGPMDARVCAMVAVGALLAVVVARWRPRGRIEWAFVIAGMGLLIGYWAAGTVYFFHYMSLPIAMFCWVLAVACSRLRRWWLIPILSIVLSWIPSRYPIERWGTIFQSFNSLVQLFPRGSVMTLDAIGVTGWQRQDCVFLDNIGLSSPVAERERRRGDGWLERQLRIEQPDGIVLYQSELFGNLPEAGQGKLLMDSTYLKRHYRPLLAAKSLINPLVLLARTRDTVVVKWHGKLDSTWIRPQDVRSK